MEYTLDARFLGEKEAAHAYLKEKLALPDYYGNNLDALYDCLTEAAPIHLYLTNADDAGPYYDRILQILCDACEVTIVDFVSE